MSPRPMDPSRQCTATSKQSGQQCKRAATPGGKTCVMHGSGTKAARAAAARSRQRAEAERAVATLGLAVDVSPTEALLEEVRWTAGHVQWLRARVQELEERALMSKPGDGEDPEDIGALDSRGTSPHPLVWGQTEYSSKTGGDDWGTKTTEKAAPNVWYQLYATERKHLVDVCAVALRAGVEERRIQIAEQQGQLFANALRAILGDLRLTPAQQQLVSTVVPRHLRAIAGGG